MEKDKEESETTPQTMTASQDNETNKEDTACAHAVDKGVRFWTHPSLLQVSADEKMQYLRSRGLSEDEIHQVWEKIVENTNEQITLPSISSQLSLHPSPEQQQQQQQQQTRIVPAPPYNPPYYETSQPNYDSDSAYDIPVLLTIGGVIGLTAAAAVRWLNGGDFLLLPPATRQGDAIEEANRIREPSINIETRVEEEEDIGIEEEEEELLVPPTNDNDDGGIQQVIQVLETHCSQQERILQQLSNFTTKQVTDQSMNLLRNSGTSSSREALTRQLTDIKAELTTIAAALSQSENTNGKSWETRLEESLQQLNECMALLQQDTTGPVSSNVVPVPIESSSVFNPLAVGTQETASSSGKSLSLREAIQNLAEENESSQLRAGAQLLYLYVINLSSHPHVPRYRKIFTTNESFQRVEQLVGGKELLLAMGFVQHQNCLEWEGGQGEEEMTFLKEAAAALSILKSASPTGEDITANALSVLRPSTPPPQRADPSSSVQTPYFIASPPNTKKHPLLTESGDELDISTISEHFESRLESLAQAPAIEDLRMCDAPDQNGGSVDSIPTKNLAMRESSDEPEEESDCE